MTKAIGKGILPFPIFLPNIKPFALSGQKFDHEILKATRKSNSQKQKQQQKQK